MEKFRGLLEEIIIENDDVSEIRNFLNDESIDKNTRRELLSMISDEELQITFLCYMC